MSAPGLASGLRLPAIALPATDGTEIDLAAVPGRSLVIVYPWTGRQGLPDPLGWDDIPGAHGSTPELEGFRARHAAFAQLGVKLIGLSRQTTEHQRELASRLALPFPIVSDAGGRFASALSLPSFTTGGEIYLTRLTLAANGGRIEHVFSPVTDPAGHAGQVLRWLNQLS